MRRLPYYFAFVLIAATCFGQQIFPNGYTFYDDFETGGMDNWSGWASGAYTTPPVGYLGLHSCTNGTSGVTSTQPHSGNYSFQVTVNGGGASTNCLTYTNFATFNPVHFRFYFYLASGFTVASTGACITEISSSSECLNFAVSGSNILLNSSCGGNGTHNITKGVWHSVEATYNSSARTVAVLLDGSTEISGTSCSLAASPTSVYIGLLDYSGNTSGTMYYDDVVVNTAAIGSPSASMVLRHSPSTFGRTALPMNLTMWGTTGSDTIVVSMDGTQEATYSGVSNAMNVQFTCCTGYSAGNHTLLVQEKTGSTVNASWTETIAAWNSTFPVEIDGYNNLSVNGSGIFPVMPFYVNTASSCSSQGNVGFWNMSGCGGAYANYFGWVTPEGSPSISQLETDLAAIKSGVGVTALAPDGAMWAGYSGSPFPTAQNAGITEYAAALASNTNLFGWTWMDEPDGQTINGNTVTAAIVANWTALTHASDPNHLVWVNTTAAWPAQKLGTGWFYPTALADVLSEDQYPFWTWCSGSGQTTITVATWLTYVDQFQRLNYHLVSYNFDIEGTAISGGTACAATGPQTRMEAWLATIHGAKSISWFSGEMGTTSASQLSGEAAFLALSQTPSVLAALTSPATSLTVTSNQTAVGTRVDAMVKQAGSTVTVFGQRLTDCVSSAGSNAHCNMETDTALSTTFTVNGCSATGTATVVGESRTVPVNSCQLTDTFNAYDTHVYQFTTNANPPPTGLTTVVH